MCARLLLDHAGEGTSPRGALLDAGTGTGILAILARRLGYEPVTALEIDAGAFRRARENLLHNDISDINLVCLDLRDHDGGPCDVIVANLLTAVLLENLSLLAQSLSEKGTLIVSGIGSQWKKEFLEALESSGLEPLVILEEENWIACRAGRKS
jgi:ribosomal protein L11 methyltransferase